MQDRIADSLPNVNAVLIARAGAVAWEWYADGVDSSTTADVYSITKSVVATFVGIALQQGWMTSLDQPVTDFFPDLATDQYADPRVVGITVRQLLSMRSGLENEVSQRVAQNSRQLVRKLLETPLLFDPGTGFQYDMANSHVLSGIVQQVGGANLATLGNRDLFPRLNIESGQWATDADLINTGWTGLFLSARDLAKIGELYRLDGVWLGTRLLPAGFAAEAAGTVTTPRPDDFADYALHWWTTDRYGPPLWIAAGYREQYLVVVPSRQLVAVIQSEAIAPRGPIVDHFPLITNFIVPAAQ